MTKPNVAAQANAQMQLYGPAEHATAERRSCAATCGGERWPTEAEERWMARQLGVELWWNVGVSTPESRRARIAKGILEIGPETIAGKRNGEPESWRALFERVFGVPLENA